MADHSIDNLNTCHPPSPKSQRLDDGNTMAITKWSGLLDSHILSIISPYLHPIDLLHLSTCCKDLTSCRYHYLSKIKLSSSSALDYGGLYRLLSQPFNRLASLDFSGRADIINVIATAMRKGTFPQLKEIVLRCHRMDGGVLLPIMEALCEGSCPNIKVLDLNMCQMGQWAATILANAIISGHLIHLQRFILNRAFAKPVDSLAVIQAIGQPGATPDLIHLELTGTYILSLHGQALGQAMRSQALTNLEELTLTGNHTLGQDGMVPIMEALSEGSCPNIKLLEVKLTRMGQRAATALANAIISGHLIHLQRLDLNYAFANAEASLAVIQAIGQPEVTPDLTHLNLTSTNMTSQHGRALGEAMRSQALANLEELILSENSCGHDDGVLLPIMEALSEGSCPKIKVMGLRGCHIGQAAATALANAVIWGHLIHLQRLDLNRASIARKALLAVIQAMCQPGATPDLIHLNLTNTNMGSQHGQALGQAMRNKALTNLKELVLSSNPDLGDNGMVPIMEALSEGSCPKIKKLILEDVGMLQASGQALAKALTSGHLHQLQHLSIHENDGIGDEAMAAIITTLGHIRVDH